MACVIVLVAIIMGFKSNLSKRQKFLTVALGPLTIIVLFVGVIVISIDHIIKYGFHDLLPKRKGKAHPLKADDFKYWPKDTILSGSDKMTIDEFNVKFNKNIRLDDVYGQAYESSLTPEEIFNCKSRIDGRIGVEPNMPDSEYKAITIAFARAFVSGDYSTIQDKLSDKTYLTLYKRETFSGAKTIIEYFKTWKKKADDEKVWYKVDVAWNPNQCRPSVSVQIKGYNNMVIFFFIKNEKIDHITFAPSHLQDYGCIYNDIDRPLLSLDFVSQYITGDSDTQENHLVCPSCGTDSALIDWYDFYMDLGPVGYSGKLTICPDCGRLVELMPDTRYRLDPFHKVKQKAHVISSTQSKSFVPRIKGQYTFENDDPCEKEKNRQGIITANNGASEEALKIFIDAAEKGNLDSMINVFTVYWANEGQYKEAAEWLKYVAGSASPSPHCLWNLAVMYFLGEDLANNPIVKDIDRARMYLSRLLKLENDSRYSSYSKIFNEARSFIESLDNFNIFSGAGDSIHDIIVNSICKTTDIKDKGELFFRAKSIRLKDGLKLGAYIASVKTESIGDESHFFVYNETGTEEKLIPEHLIVDKTAMGAFQLYLVLTAHTVMPVFWHGGYIVRDFIFNPDDITKIKPIQNYDFSILLKDDNLLPKVELASDKSYADVYCSYWNDWEGLIREHYRIKFNADGTASVVAKDKFTFYKYDCGICF